MNSEELASLTYRGVDVTRDDQDKAAMSKKDWDLKCTTAKSSPSRNKKVMDYDCLAPKDTWKTFSIGQDLDSISSSLTEGEQQQTSSSVIGNSKVMLRPTAHGKALKEGNEIKSRKFGRSQKLTEDVDSPKTSTEKLLRDLPSDPCCMDGEMDASRMNDSAGSLDHKKINLHPPTTHVSPATRNGTTRHNALSSPFRRANLHPTGPTKELREGTEKGRKFLRLLELSELMIDKSESTDSSQFQDSGGSLDYSANQERLVFTPLVSQMDEGDEESLSSDNTDISSGDSENSPENPSRSKNKKNKGESCGTYSLRPNHIRGMSFDRLEGNVFDGKESEKSSSPRVNNVGPSCVSSEAIVEGCKPRRAGRRPVTKHVDDCDNEQRNYKDSGTKIDDRKRAGRHRRSGGPKKTNLRPPGDTSSEEDEDSLHEEDDLRAALANTPKIFRRRNLVYCLPKRKRDIVRKIYRKRSVRPKIAFLKLLPNKKPTIKGLLHGPIEDLTDDESDGSSQTPTITNLSRIAKKRQEAVTYCRKMSWNPPNPTPPPASFGREDQPPKPVWTGTQLKATGQKEKIVTLGNLAKPITFPEKEASAPIFSRVALRPTEQGEALQRGAAILSRRARRQQELNQILNQSD